MTRRARGGIALGALGAIVIVTMAWWALALYPAGAAAPEWLARTRLACFGAAPGGLPNAGGWLSLIGQPVGMLAVLMTVWGDALRSDLRSLTANLWGRALLACSAGAVAVAALASAVVVQRVRAARAEASVVDGMPRVGTHVLPGVPPLALVDQHGLPFDLTARAGGPVLVTFAFAHCATVCPTLVSELLRVRRRAARGDIPLVIVTVDPWRDVPARLSTIAARWRLAQGDRVLGGDIPSVTRVLDDWGIGHSRDARTGDVTHAAVVFLVDRGGRRATRFDADWKQLEAQLAEA